MEEELNTRPMAPVDYEDLVALWSCFPGNALTAADSRDGFLTFLQANRGFCLVAEDEGRLIGSVMAGQDTRRGYIYHLAVSEQYHGRGIARLLMNEVEDALRNAGIEKAHLFIYTDNPAVAFYEKAGWKLRRDIHVMSKVLGGAPLQGPEWPPADPGEPSRKG
jgi:ribosomal protein S18 acetylase RimI-like enzyme